VLAAVVGIALVLAAVVAPTIEAGENERIGLGTAEQYDIDIEPDPVPGRTVTVTVTQDGEPVTDARILFNGEFVGRTDARGQVTGEVPYEEQLVVTVREPPGDLFARPQLTTASVVPLSTHVDQRATPRRNHSVRLPTAMNVTVQGEARPGQNVTVLAVVEGIPVEDGVVRVDGDAVGRTNAEGTYRLSIPRDAPDRLTVTVERGPVDGTTEVVVLRLAIRVQPHTLVALPGQDATLTVSFGPRRMANATVLQDGRRIGTTDARGRLTIALPWGPSTTVTARTSEGRVRQRIGGLYLRAVVVSTLLLAVLGSVLVVLAGVVTGGTVAAMGPVGRGIGWIWGALLALRGWRPELRQRLSEWVTLIRTPALWATALASTARAVGSDIADVVRRVLAGIGAATLAVGTFVRELRTLSVADLRAWLHDIGRWLWHLPTRSSGAEASDQPPADDHSTDNAAVDRRSVEALWRAFARRVTPDWETRTAGEVSREAAAEWPREPVATLAETFRTAAYAPDSPAEETIEQAREAYGRLTEEEGE
jgi:hypothetical protein